MSQHWAASRPAYLLIAFGKRLQHTARPPRPALAARGARPLSVRHNGGTSRNFLDPGQGTARAYTTTTTPLCRPGQRYVHAGPRPVWQAWRGGAGLIQCECGHRQSVRSGLAGMGSSPRSRGRPGREGSRWKPKLCGEPRRRRAAVAASLVAPSHNTFLTRIHLMRAYSSQAARGAGRGGGRRDHQTVVRRARASSTCTRASVGPACRPGRGGARRPDKSWRIRRRVMPGPCPPGHGNDT